MIDDKPLPEEKLSNRVGNTAALAETHSINPPCDVGEPQTEIRKFIGLEIMIGGAIGLSIFTHLLASLHLYPQVAELVSRLVDGLGRRRSSVCALGLAGGFCILGRYIFIWLTYPIQRYLLRTKYAGDVDLIVWRMWYMVIAYLAFFFTFKIMTSNDLSGLNGIFCLGVLLLMGFPIVYDILGSVYSAIKKPDNKLSRIAYLKKGFRDSGIFLVPVITYALLALVVADEPKLHLIVVGLYVFIGLYLPTFILGMILLAGFLFSLLKKMTKNGDNSGEQNPNYR